MGTRLYPSTNNETILEQLAGVPPATATKLKEFEVKHQYDPRDPEKGYEIYCLLLEQTDLFKFQEFNLYGWGRLTSSAYQLIEQWQLPEEGGSTTDLNQVAALLKVMNVDTFGVNLKDIEGLSWG